MENEQPVEEEKVLDARVYGVFFVGAKASQGCVILEAVGRYLTVYIGMDEALNLDAAFRGETTPRPTTHDLVKTVLDYYGVKVEGMVLDDLEDGVYYARLYVGKGDDHFVCDARPSDALAMCLRACAPIRASAHLIAAAAVGKEEVDTRMDKEE